MLGLKIGKRLLGPILAAFGISFIIIGALMAVAPYPLIPIIWGWVPGAVFGSLGVIVLAYVFLFIWESNQSLA